MHQPPIDIHRPLSPSSSGVLQEGWRWSDHCAISVSLQ